MRLSTKKQQTLLTLSVLLGLSSPVYAQDIQNNDVINTPDVVVTATRTQEEVKAVPQTVEVITKEDIEQLGATDIYSALKLATNVDVSQIGAGHRLMVRGKNAGALVLLDGRRISNEYSSMTRGAFDLDKIKRQIGYVSDDENKFLKLKAIEYLNFVCDMYDISQKERRDRILTLSRRFNIEKDLNTMMDKFSKGMKQKIMIIASLLHMPKVWILDEPFTGLDPATSYELKTLMKEYAEKGNIVILSSHILEIVENLCDKVLLIKKGKNLYYGNLSDLKKKYRLKNNLEEIYMEVFKDEEVNSFSKK